MVPTTNKDQPKNLKHYGTNNKQGPTQKPQIYGTKNKQGPTQKPQTLWYQQQTRTNSKTFNTMVPTTNKDQLKNLKHYGTNNKQGPTQKPQTLWYQQQTRTNSKKKHYGTNIKQGPTQKPQSLWYQQQTRTNSKTSNTMVPTTNKDPLINLKHYGTNNKQGLDNTTATTESLPKNGRQSK